MKKRSLICLLLTVFLCINLFANCSPTKKQSNNDSPQSSKEVTQESEKASEESKETPSESAITNVPIVLNETIVTEYFEITIKKIEFSYDILPDDTSGFYTHYPADSGKVYVHLDTDIKNTQKQQLKCDNIGTVTVDYNSGYEYTGRAVPEDTNLGFTYANITAINPLESLGVRFLVECPQEVETSTNPVIVFLEINNIIYEYVLR